MNERIEELAEQAGMKTISYEQDEDTHFADSIDIEKFAELIVQECMLCCERVISDPVPKSVDTWLNGGLQCIEEIKQHFGVEQ